LLCLEAQTSRIHFGSKSQLKNQLAERHRSQSQEFKLHLHFGGTNGISAGTFSTPVDSNGSIVLSYVSATPPRPVIENNITGAGTTNATIRWSSVAVATYEVRYRNDINDTNWLLLGTITATNSTASIVDSSNPPAPKRFYRVFVQ